MFSWPTKVFTAVMLPAVCLSFSIALSAQAFAPANTASSLPRTLDGRPDMQGIWQASSTAAADLQAAGKGVVEGGQIPYLPAALAKKQANFTNRKADDPLGKCFLPGVPRIMYLQYPFQIFQTAEQVAITFEWTQVYRLIYTNGKPPLHAGVESWMGDSRGHWDGDTLVVEVTGQNDKTWFDLAGDFHSDALKVTERYKMMDANTIQYEATIDDPKTFGKPWKITLPLVRQQKMDRLPEYQCQAEKEEENGAFERDSRTWYPKSPKELKPLPAMAAAVPLAPVKTGTNLRRMAVGSGKTVPDLSGYYESDNGTANQGLERHAPNQLTPGGRGVVVDPADRLLPYQPWAKAERDDRMQPYRGYDDPTAHCFVAGVPRSVYIPSPFQIVQTPNYLVMLFERMSWRVIPLDGRAHRPDNIRLWQGDSVGHWDGDTLVVETTNLNGKAWLNEVGDMVSYAERVEERFSPVDPQKMIYRATVSDPLVYTRPWTIEFPINKQAEELLEVACLEDNGDLQHLKDVRDEFRAKQKKSKEK